VIAHSPLMPAIGRESSWAPSRVKVTARRPPCLSARALLDLLATGDEERTTAAVEEALSS
jgi:hypothetical protein